MVVVVQKGLTLAELPDAKRENIFLGLLHKGAYTSGCQMPEDGGASVMLGVAINLEGDRQV